MLRILSWNIRQGGGTRLLKICQKLVDSKAEILVLSEFRNNASGHAIRNNLLKAGYKHQYVGAAKTDENTAAIFSKIPANFQHYPGSDPSYHHNVISASYEAFVVYGMYLPHKKKHVLFDLLIQQAQREKPAIMVGDFNTGKNFIDQKGNSFWYTDKLKTLEEKGMCDAFRYLHNELSEFSWFSHLGNGYRYDHSYAHKSLLAVIKECYYLHEWREEKLSDHSPMMLVLG